MRVWGVQADGEIVVLCKSVGSTHILIIIQKS